MSLSFYEMMCGDPDLFDNDEESIEEIDDLSLSSILQAADFYEPIDLSSGSFISDAIDKLDVRFWDDLDVRNILIMAGTGTGKSTFCYTTLAEIAQEQYKKVLFLTPRNFLTEQVRVEINKIREFRKNNIDVFNYHAIAPLTDEELRIMSAEYKYVILDECHFFESDSSFNNKTDKILEKILKINATNIFMSATPGKLFNSHIVEGGHRHKIYKFVKEQTVPKKLYMSFDSASRDRLINQCIRAGQKAFIFIDSARLAYKVYKQYEDKASFVCSEYNKEYAKYMNLEDKNYFIKTNKIPKDILITTSVLSTGVNLKDENLGLVYIDSLSPSEVKQAIGRDRLGISQVVLANQNKKRIAANRRMDLKRLDVAYKYTKQMTVIMDPNNINRTCLYNEFLDRYGSDLITKYPNMFSINKDNTLSLNDSSKLAAKMRVKDYDIMLREDYMGFIKNHLLREYNIDLLRIETDLKIKEQQHAYKVADKYIGKRFYGKEKEKIINDFNFIDKQKNRQIRGRQTINRELEELTNGIYSLIDKRDTKRRKYNKKNPNYGKTYWTIKKNKNDLSIKNKLKNMNKK